MKTFRNLPKAQAAVFDQLCVQNDAGHNPATLKALMKKGLIVERREVHGAFSISRYDVPTTVHMEWCQWCSEQVESGNDAESST